MIVAVLSGTEQNPAYRLACERLSCRHVHGQCSCSWHLSGLAIWHSPNATIAVKTFPRLRLRARTAVAPFGPVREEYQRVPRVSAVQHARTVALAPSARSGGFKAWARSSSALFCFFCFASPASSITSTWSRSRIARVVVGEFDHAAELAGRCGRGSFAIG